MSNENFTIKDTTHNLQCSHSFNRRSRREYTMSCLILKEMPNNRCKILVFGEREWSGAEHISKVRYVDKSRLSLKRSE